MNDTAVQDANDDPSGAVEPGAPDSPRSPQVQPAGLSRRRSSGVLWAVLMILVAALGWLAATAFQFAAHPFHILQHQGHMAGQDFPGRSQAQPTGQALEQGRADFVFEFENLPVHRRRGDVQSARGFTDRMAAADHIEVANGRRVDTQRAVEHFFLILVGTASSLGAGRLNGFL